MDTLVQTRRPVLSIPFGWSLRLNQKSFVLTAPKGRCYSANHSKPRGYMVRTKAPIRMLRTASDLSNDCPYVALSQDTLIPESSCLLFIVCDNPVIKPQHVFSIVTQFSQKRVFKPWAVEDTSVCPAVRLEPELTEQVLEGIHVTGGQAWGEECTKPLLNEACCCTIWQES